MTNTGGAVRVGDSASVRVLVEAAANVGGCQTVWFGQFLTVRQGIARNDCVTVHTGGIQMWLNCLQ